MDPSDTRALKRTLEHRAAELRALDRVAAAFRAGAEYLGDRVRTTRRRTSR